MIELSENTSYSMTSADYSVNQKVLITTWAENVTLRS